MTDFRPIFDENQKFEVVGISSAISAEISTKHGSSEFSDDIPIKHVTIVVVGNSSEYTNELPTTFRLTDITVTVVGIPSEFSDEFPTNHVTVADKYI